jgi:hypothetical protein
MSEFSGNKYSICGEVFCKLNVLVMEYGLRRIFRFNPSPTASQTTSKYAKLRQTLMQ